jgi:hypothetical protein
MAKTYVRLPQGLQRVVLEPRGSRSSSMQSLLDVRGERVELELMADLLNLLNETAETTLVSDDLYGPNFGKPNSFFEPRSAMLGIKLRF